MSADRLSPLDASFLEVETSSAHMHVGWAAVFAPPRQGPPPSFEQLRDHVARRLQRAPRFRQKLAPVPLGLNRPVWVDDESFRVERHVRRGHGQSLTELAGQVMSTPLSRERPLWEFWLLDRLDDGRIGLVGKAHHCMVDGIAAVELGSLLLDPTRKPPASERDDWRPAPAPGSVRRLAEGVADRLKEELNLLTLPARVASSPRRIARAVGQVERAAQALISSFTPTRPLPPLNEPLSPYRALAVQGRPLEELTRIKRTFGTTVNDVVLAVSAGGVRRLFEQRGEQPCALKAMVPVNARGADGGVELGNRISWVFIELPCDEPDPLRRLLHVHQAMRKRKEAGEPEGADAVVRLLGAAPSSLQRAVSHLVASPRTFNVVVSNIPGPRERLYMLGCELQEAYPVVPLADRHTLSIGFTTIADGAFFGIYVDRDAVPDADVVARGIGDSIDELLGRIPAGARVSLPV